MLHFKFLSDHKVLMSSFHLKIRQSTCSCNAIEFIVFSCTAIVLCRREREDIGLNTTLLKLFLPDVCALCGRIVWRRGSVQSNFVVIA